MTKASREYLDRKPLLARVMCRLDGGHKPTKQFQNFMEMKVTCEKCGHQWYERGVMKEKHSGR